MSAAHHEFAAESDAHQLELMFECDLESDPRLGQRPDAMQTGIDWLELNRLPQHRLYPKVLRQLLATDVIDAGPVYLGDVN